MFEREENRQARRVDALTRSLDRKPRPIELPEEVVRATGRRRDAADPIPVTAMIPVTYSYADLLEVDAQVVAWTQKAVLVEYAPHPGSAPKRIWIWASAVTRKDPRRRR